jgi:hypothetical protein
MGQLRDDMRWWFERSGHQVKIVLLVKFDHCRRVIVLEKCKLQCGVFVAPCGCIGSYLALETVHLLPNPFDTS